MRTNSLNQAVTREIYLWYKSVNTRYCYCMFTCNFKIFDIRKLILLVLFSTVSILGFSQKNSPHYFSRNRVTDYINNEKIGVYQFFSSKKNGYSVKVKSTIVKIDSIIINSEDGKSYSLSFAKGYTFQDGDINLFFQNEKIDFSVPWTNNPEKASKGKIIEKEFKKALKTLFADYENYINGEIDPLYMEHADSLLTDFKTKVINIKESISSEEQRKYIVQANAAKDEKEYDLAIELFEKANTLNAYSYPSAYFNIALLYSQVNKYYEAIFNMKKYLLLVPHAEDARAAQDKIYEWEMKIEIN